MAGQQLGLHPAVAVEGGSPRTESPSWASSPTPRVLPKALSSHCGRPGFLGSDGRTCDEGRLGRRGPGPAYQSWLSQPSSTCVAGGAGFLAPLALPSPQASPTSLWSLLLLLDAEPEPHTSQLSELRFSAEASAHVQLSLLGDLWALAGSLLPKVSQKLWSTALLWYPWPSGGLGNRGGHEQLFSKAGYGPSTWCA